MKTWKTVGLYIPHRSGDCVACGEVDIRWENGAGERGREGEEGEEGEEKVPHSTYTQQRLGSQRIVGSTIQISHFTWQIFIES
jgi:hypothetical protein